VKTVAYKILADSYFPGWIRSLKRVECMDFDILAPGHGNLGTKADVTLFREYLRVRLETLCLNRIPCETPG